MSQVHFGEAQEHYNVAGTRVLKYTLEMSHNGLNEHKLVSAPDLYMLKNKAKIQAEKWNEKWNVVETKRQQIAEKQANAEEALNQTRTAEDAVKEIDNLLVHTLSIDDTVDWNSLKKKDSFPEKKPIKPSKPNHETTPHRPDKSEEMFIPKFTFIEKVFKGLKNKKISEYEDIYANAISAWETKRKNAEEANKKIDDTFDKATLGWQQKVTEWEHRKDAFLQEQEAYNAKIDAMKIAYLEKNPTSIVEYCEMVLNNSTYPESFSKDFEIEFNPENSILIVEYQLPSMELMPRIKEVKYLASKNELKETYFPEPLIAKMFDEAMYKITLRTIHELFEADEANALESISFNGWVRAINRATGKEENNCIISLQVKKAKFLEIDLRNVEPKVCFRNLKGVAGSKLSSLTPIKPILQIDKNDKRFVDSYAVVDGLDNSTNLAAMDWEDFEHLIRELFEKEFKASGGEVKVTQASRDGGVDAVAFDPDPIRGGKIVIQAKRYTNTVGVSAVRDLYGTVMNEGATKGILVSTADYGPDAYEFAKGKPLTLLSGSNLLHLLEKHGTHAKIDLKEAKRIIAEKEKGMY
jgi:restriction system protein